jgi:hypothetical protein
LAIGVAVIIIGMLINPPSKVREEFQRAHPKLFPKPATTNFNTGQWGSKPTITERPAN